MLRLVHEKPGELDFYFTDNNIEYDICLRNHGEYHILYLNCEESIHEHYIDIEPFIEPLNEILNILPYIDSFNEYLDICISSGFREHRDLVKRLSLKEIKDLRIYGEPTYLIRKGNEKNDKM